MKLLLLFLAFMPLGTLMAQNSPISVSFGDVQIGRSRIDLKLEDFHLIKMNEKIPYRVNFIKGSLQWVRDESNLLIPRVRVEIRLKRPTKSGQTFFIRYGVKTIIPITTDKDLLFDLYLNLFNPGTLYLHRGSEIIGQLTVESKIRPKEQKTKLIDYSCSRYNLKFEGLEGEYMSIGCRMEKIGHWGKERPRLAVTWSATNLQLVDGTPPPFTTYLLDNRGASITTQDKHGRQRMIKIKATLPKRLHRMKLAYGFGPYIFSANQGVDARNDKLSPALMIYGKFDMGRTTSLRFFDAFVMNKSIFNNSGMYFAYELADAMDGRIQFVPLIGFQGLSFGHDKKSFQHELIFPQGFEIVYRNAFGIENYNVVYGTFLSTSSKERYTNLWLRWGKGYFWELNFIDWQKDEREARMYGLSIGLPLAQFL